MVNKILEFSRIFLGACVGTLIMLTGLWIFVKYLMQFSPEGFFGDVISSFIGVIVILSCILLSAFVISYIVPDSQEEIQANEMEKDNYNDEMR